MAKFKAKEFYELCGISKGNFYTYKKRGNIHVSEDGLVDSAHPVNAAFMNKRVMNKKTIPTPVAPSPAAPVVSAQKPKPIKRTKAELKAAKDAEERDQKRQDDSDAQATHRYNLDRQIKEAELTSKEQTIELNKLKISKLSGEVIPTQLVKEIFAQHFKSVTVSMHQGCDNFIMTIAKTTGMKKQDMARMRGELIEIVNEAVRDGVEDSKESIKNIVNEYKDKRGVGERK